MRSILGVHTIQSPLSWSRGEMSQRPSPGGVLGEGRAGIIYTKYLHLPRETEKEKEREGGKERNQNKREICRHRFVDMYTYTYLHVNVWRDVDLYCVPLKPQRMQGKWSKACQFRSSRKTPKPHENCPVMVSSVQQKWSIKIPVQAHQIKRLLHPFTCLPCPLKTHPSSAMDWAPSATVHLDRTAKWQYIRHAYL